MDVTKRLKDPIRPLPNFQYKLPLKLSFKASASTGANALSFMGICLFGLGLTMFFDRGPDSKGRLILFALGALISGLIAYSKREFYRRAVFEISLDESHLLISKDLVKGAEYWRKFSDEKYLKIFWDDITSWEFQNLAAEGDQGRIRSTGSGANEHWIRLRQSPEKKLVLDRELLLEIEDEFMTVVEQILSGKNIFQK